VNRFRGAFILLGLLLGVTRFGAHDARAVALPANPSPRVGPREVERSEDAARPGNFDALAAMLADPNGPKSIVLGPHTYRGDLVIARPLALYGGRGTVIEGTGTGSVVTIRTSDVVVEDVTVRHSGHRHTTEDAGIKATGSHIRIAHVDVADTLFGISFEECKFCEIQAAHVVGYEEETELRGDGIKLWESNDSSVRDCVVEHARDLVVWYTKRASLEGNTVRGGRYGTHFMYAHDAVVRNSRLEGNVVGIFVMYSKRLTLDGNVLAGARGAAGMGLGFKDSDSITARGNWIVANTTGTYLDNTPRTREDAVTFDGNMLALNDVAVRLHSADAGLVFRGNDFRQNAWLIEVDGGGTALSVAFRGNHYSDYEGYDLDRDGVGDVAYEVKLLSGDLTERRPVLKYFRGTAAMGLVDAVAHAIPVLAANKLLSDGAPLMQSPITVEP
jgi:nitrous oxidase accessory protein